jgi:hypothetical protein
MRIDKSLTYLAILVGNEGTRKVGRTDAKKGTNASQCNPKIMPRHTGRLQRMNVHTCTG